jgi:hypothetical protein
MENKQTLWIFGDSFSTPFDNKILGQWDTEYCNWKGYIPKHFGDIMANELGVELRHCGMGGIDNDTIFEKIIKQASKINKGDMIIIGWSNVGRFRLVNNRDGKFKTIVPNFIDDSLKWFDNISKSTIEEIVVNRTHHLYKEELYTKIEFLNFFFKDMKLIQWTPFIWDGIKILGFKTINTILTETNGAIKDGHYSELGHIEVSKTFIDMLNDDKLRNDSNRLYTKLI